MTQPMRPPPAPSKLLAVQPPHKQCRQCGTRALPSEVNQPAAGRSDANLNRTHAPAIARIDAPFHDVAAVFIIVIISVVRIIVVVVVGIGSVQTQAERGTDENRPAEAMVKAAVVKSTGPEACEPTGPESRTTVEGAGPADGCRAEPPGCTNSGRTETAWTYFYNAPLGGAQRIESGDYLDHLRIRR